MTNLKTEKEYVDSPSSCINKDCGSTDIEGGPIQIDDNTAWQKITCNMCQLEWDDIYILSGYDNGAYV